MDSRIIATRDHEVVAGRSIDVPVRGCGSSAVLRTGRLGGAIYAEWPGGRPAVVTRFRGLLAEAARTVEVLAHVRARGLPVARHDLVVDLDDGVVFVQERLPSAPPRGD